MLDNKVSKNTSFKELLTKVKEDGKLLAKVKKEVKSLMEYKEAEKLPFNIIDIKTQYELENMTAFKHKVLSALEKHLKVEGMATYLTFRSAPPHDDRMLWGHFYFINIVISGDKKYVLDFYFKNKKYKYVFNEGDAFILDTRKPHWCFPLDTEASVEPAVILNIPVRRTEIRKIKHLINDSEPYLINLFTGVE